jgi:mannose-1-phosphate guanylyltransferase / mannose-6-phosphate isomerase
METKLNNTDISYLETETRPWGAFFNLADGKYKMKVIQVNPGEELSVQSHTKRSEKWICLEGILTVNLGETLESLTEYHLVPNQTIDIPRGYIHQAKNDTKGVVYFFELQTGSYFGEDDIIRYSDVYGRN